MIVTEPRADNLGMTPGGSEGRHSSHRPVRFDRRLLSGRTRRNLFGGLLLLAAGLGYGTWAIARLASRGAEPHAFDVPVIRVASTLVIPPDVRPAFTPTTDDETYLLAVITDQQDILFGLTVLLLRLVVAGTVAGLGLVLLTAGATEWEVRSISQ